MDISDLQELPVKRIKVRALVKCGDEYIFIRRTRPTKKKPYLVFPGGRLKKKDRVKGDKKNLGRTLKEALIRELHEELSAREVVIGEVLAINQRAREWEVLFRVEVASINWEERSGKEFNKSSKGTYELVRIKELTKDVLGKRGYRLKPKIWRKVLYSFSHSNPAK